MYTHTTQLQDTTIFFCGGVQNKLFLIDTKQDGAIMTFDGLRPMPTHSLSVVPDSSPGIYVYMRMCWYLCMYMHETPPTHSRSVVPDSSARTPTRARAHTHTHTHTHTSSRRRRASAGSAERGGGPSTVRAARTYRRWGHFGRGGVLAFCRCCRRRCGCGRGGALSQCQACGGARGAVHERERRLAQRACPRLLHPAVGREAGGGGGRGGGGGGACSPINTGCS